MPPKVRITKESIVKTTIELVKKSGAEAINARAIATELECSTQPIFSNFSTMEKLRSEIISAAYGIYLGFLARERESGEYPPYKAYGMAYIRFAIEERELFKLLFMRDRTGEDLSPSADFEECARIISEANGVSVDKARLIHLELWSCVHGIAVMIATSFLPLSLDLISGMISDVYLGITAKNSKEED
jgi:AcrR family transcriptional regulator